MAKNIYKGLRDSRGCTDAKCTEEAQVSDVRDPHPIRATNQVVGIIGYGWGSVIGRKLAR